MRSLKEGKYKIVSTSAATLDTIAKPAVRHSHQLMMEGSNQLESSVNSLIDKIPGSTSDTFSWIFSGLKQANSAFHRVTRSGISTSFQDKMSLVQSFEEYLTTEQQDLEEYFSQNNIRIHHNWVFSKENRETIKQLTSLVSELSKNIRNIPYHKIWQYCMAYTCIQKTARHYFVGNQAVKLNPELIEGCRGLKYFSKYSMAIYGRYLVNGLIEKKWTSLLGNESEEDIFCRYVGIPNEKLIYSHMASRRGIPAHTISIDSKIRAVVLTVRGTNSVFDCMTDLKSDYVAYTVTTSEGTIEGEVHSGIMESAICLGSEILAIIQSCLIEYPGYKVVLTGHSLGAGISALLALHWLNTSALNCPLACYLYAPPAVLSLDLNQVLMKSTFSCIYGNDIVCRLSLGSINDLSTVINYLNQKELNDSAFSARDIAEQWVSGRKGNEEELLRIYGEIKSKCNAYKLIPPGNSYQVYEKSVHSDYFLLSKGTEELTGSYVNPDFYSEIILDKTCFFDHLPHTYEKAIISLVVNPYD